MNISQKLKDNLIYFIVGILESSIGVKRALSILIKTPLLPKHFFLGAKCRHFVRYKMHEESARYLGEVISTPHLNIAFRLPSILSCFTLNKNGLSPTTREQINKLKQLLISCKPLNEQQCYKVIYTLIKCYDFHNATSMFRKHKHLLTKRNISLFENYLTFIDSLFEGDFTLLSEGWDNTINKNNANNNKLNKIAFYFPPTITKLEIASTNKNNSFYRHNSIFFHNLFKSIPFKHTSIIPMLQFSWRSIDESKNHLYHSVVSYHTHGPANNNLRIKESAFFVYLTIDPNGFSGWHSNSNKKIEELLIANADRNAVNQHFEQLNSTFVSENQSKYQQPSISSKSSNLPESYHFLCLQVTNDIVAELSYIPCVELLKQCCEICVKHKQNLVIKRHPKCNSYNISSLLRKYSRNSYITVSIDSIHNIIKYSKSLITVNSGVGMEALLHLKPIICSGKAEYSPIAKEVKSQQELEEAIISTPKISEIQIKSFLYSYFQNDLYRYDDRTKLVNFWKTHINNSNKNMDIS